MKTNKIIFSVFILSLFTLTSTFAMYGGGNGQGQSKGRQANQIAVQEKKSDHTPGDLLGGVELQDISEHERSMLLYGYSEELLAHDMYNYFYELYGLQTFKNIANSEAEHMQAVKLLLDRYEIDIPTDYGELSDEFNTLKSQGEESLQKALEVGVQIEILDIDDIARNIARSDNDDIKIIFTNIGGASYNHLRGFLKALENNNLSTDIDYSDYITDEEIQTKGGALKIKMAEKLESQGVILPLQAQSKKIQEKCDQKNNGGQNGSGNKQKGIQNSQGKKMQTDYKIHLKQVYGMKLQKMSNQELANIVNKIDILNLDIAQRNISVIQKQKYKAILSALRELSLEYKK